MKERLRQLVVLASIGVLILFVIFVINQTVQIAALAYDLHPLFGEVVKYLLIAVYALLVIFSFYQFWKLPKALKWPGEGNSKAYITFLLNIRKRLIRNKNLPAEFIDQRLRPPELETNIQALEQSIREAEAELDKLAEKELKITAQTVFVSTAVSQSGSLDVFVVLTAQARMVWRIARLYNQRPALREMTRLYANVAVTSFAAKAIEDIDVAEVLEPVINGFSGVALVNIVPVISLLTNSIFTGTANALLTLRTGIIARRYCGLFAYYESRKQYGDEKKLLGQIRRSAIREAGMMLGGVIMGPSKQVFGGILGGLKKAGALPAKAVEEIGKASKEVITRISDIFKRKSES